MQGRKWHRKLTAAVNATQRMKQAYANGDPVALAEAIEIARKSVQFVPEIQTDLETAIAQLQDLEQT